MRTLFALSLLAAALLAAAAPTAAHQRTCLGAPAPCLNAIGYYETLTFGLTPRGDDRVALECHVSATSSPCYDARFVYPGGNWHLAVSSCTDTLDLATCNAVTGDFRVTIQDGYYSSDGNPDEIFVETFVDGVWAFESHTGNNFIDYPWEYVTMIVEPLGSPEVTGDAFLDDFAFHPQGTLHVWLTYR